MSQPEILPVLATDDDYPAGSEDWSGQPTRLAMSLAFQQQGFTPETQAASDEMNWLLGLTLEHLAAIVDMAAINFPTIHNTSYDSALPTDVFNSGINHKRVAIRPATTPNDSSQICAVGKDASDRAWISLDGRHWAVGNNDALLFSSNGTIIAAGAGVGYLAIDGSADTSKYSGNSSLAEYAAWTSGGTLPTSGSWGALGYFPAAAKWIAMGSSKLANAPNTPSAWTSGPTSPLATNYTRLCAAAAGSAMTDAILIGATSQTTIGILSSALGAGSVTPDGATAHVWTDAVYSETHGAWFLLATDGTVFRSAVVAGPWTKVAALPNSRTSITCLGRTLIVTGLHASTYNLHTCSDPLGVEWRTHSVFQGSWLADAGSPPEPTDWTLALPFGGRVILVRTTDEEFLETAVSLALPGSIPTINYAP